MEAALEAFLAMAQTKGLDGDRAMSHYQASRGSRSGSGSRAEIFSQMAERSGLDLKRFGAPRSREEILQDHHKCIDAIKDRIKMLSQGGACMTNTFNSLVKPSLDFPTPPDPAGCTPIIISQLKLDTTHRQRVLRGTLAVEAFAMNAAQTVLEDEKGDLVKLCVYNRFSAEDLNELEKQELAKKCFPKGQAIAVIEPYYKIFADGTRGVRVDNPQEVVLLSSLGPTDAPGWQEEGKKHYKQQQYKEAATCYVRALQALHLEGPPGSQQGGAGTGTNTAKLAARMGSGKPLLLPILLNLSATYLKMENARLSLSFATAAAVLSPTSSKAHYRLSLSLALLAAEEPGLSPAVTQAARSVMHLAVDMLSPRDRASARASMMAQLEALLDLSSRRAVRSSQKEGSEEDQGRSEGQSGASAVIDERKGASEQAEDNAALSYVAHQGPGHSETNGTGNRGGRRRRGKADGDNTTASGPLYHKDGAPKDPARGNLHFKGRACQGQPGRQGGAASSGTSGGPMAPQVLYRLPSASELDLGVGSLAQNQQLVKVVVSCCVPALVDWVVGANDTTSTSRTMGPSGSTGTLAGAATCGAGGTAKGISSDSAASSTKTMTKEEAVRMVTATSADSELSTRRVPAPGATVDEAKQKGNDAFQAGDYTTALNFYLDAYRLLEDVLPTAAVQLSNHSACMLQLAEPQSKEQATLDALVSLVLHPGQVKAHYRLAQGLTHLGWLTEAATACDWGLSFTNDKNIKELQDRIRILVADSASIEEGFAPGSQSLAPDPGREASTSMVSSGSATPGLQARSQVVADCEAGPSTSAGPSAGVLSQKVSKAGGSKKSNRKKKSGAGKFLSEREAEGMLKKDMANVEQVAMMNTLMAAAAAMGKKAELKGIPLGVDDRVPPMHEELARGGRWPPLVDVEACHRHVWHAYELARGMAVHAMALIRPKTAMDEMSLMKRLGTNDMNRIRWFVEAPQGDVSFFRQGQYTGGNTFLSFSNVPEKMDVLTPGRTHVAVGFVDLGGLAASCLCLPDLHEGDWSEGPLRWVGYEQCPYAVAKTLVVLQMMRQKAEVDPIIQVWYSSAWTHRTLQAFRKALTAVLQGIGKPGKLLSEEDRGIKEGVTRAVRDLLMHWQQHDVTLERARRSWWESLGDTGKHVANFKRKTDRLALWQYLLTGQLLDGEVGSVVMFALPNSFVRERAMDEDFMETLELWDLLNCCTGGYQLPGGWGRARPAASQEKASNIVEAGLMLLRARVGQLSTLVASGHVHAEVHHAPIHLGAKPLLDHIRYNLQPWHVSWSNVPDYLHPMDFHQLALSLSATKDTVHMLHTMNWPMEMKGAVHMDFVVDVKEEYLPEVISGLLSSGNAALEMLYQTLGYGSHLLSPPVDNPRNIIDYCLFVQHHQAFVKAFFDRKYSGIGDLERQVYISYPPQYSILSRTNSTCYVCFTYDPAVRLMPTGPGMALQ